MLKNIFQGRVREATDKIKVLNCEFCHTVQNGHSLVYLVDLPRSVGITCVLKE